MKLTNTVVVSLLVVVQVALRSSEAFAFVPLSQKKNTVTTTSSLHVVREKGQITAPSLASDEETSAIYDKNVQTTYG